MNSQLAPSATEFIPSKGISHLASLSKWEPRSLEGDDSKSGQRTTISSMSGMNLAASEWIPQGKRNVTYDKDLNLQTNPVAINHLSDHNGTETESTIDQNIENTYYPSPSEKMVEINWNGSVFFVPQESITSGEMNDYPGAEILDPSVHDEAAMGIEKNSALISGHPLVSADADAIPATAANGFGTS